MKANLDRKKLLIISLHADPSMPPGVSEWGGTHTYMRELLTDLCDTKYEVVLITRKVYPSDEDSEYISNSCRVLRLTLGNFEKFDKRELFDLHEQTLQQTFIMLDKINFRPDIIHSVYWNSGHVAMKLSNLWNIPYVHSVISNGRGRNAHGATGTAPHRIETEEMVFKNASFILCVAESEKAEISTLYNIPNKKIVVAGQYVHPAFINTSHNRYGEPRKSGINYKIESTYLSNFQTSQSTECIWWSKNVFTYTGRLSLDKGLNHIIHAWILLEKKYQQSCPPLWIIGGSAVDIDSIRHELGIEEKELAILEKSGKLIWWGYLDENGVSAIYTKTLALVTHSKYEPGGRVAIEAMCEEIPVLATPNGFALDTIHDWVNGFLIEFGDVNSLSLRMEHFIKQPYLSDYMGYQAKQTGQSVVTEWAFKETHLSAYHNAIENNEDFYKKNRNKNFLYAQRDLHVFPFNKNLVDAADIIQIMNDNGIADIKSVEKAEMGNSSSMIWEVKTKNIIYYVKMPSDRINLFPLWSDFDDQPKVISGLSRYRAEISAASFSEIPVLIGKSEIHHALIRKKYEAKEISKNLQLTTMIEKIFLFQKNNKFDCLEFIEKLDVMINQESNYKKVDIFYNQLIKNFAPDQNYFMDYSLRVELKRWWHYYEILESSQQEKIDKVFKTSYRKAKELSVNEAIFAPVINHGGCDYKNLIFVPEPILLDNEKFHIGWSGIDYADFLITFVQKNYPNDTFEVWENIMSLIPQHSIAHDILVGWLLLSVCKEAVSEVACLKQIKPRLQDRSEALLRLCCTSL